MKKFILLATVLLSIHAQIRCMKRILDDTDNSSNAKRTKHDEINLPQKYDRLMFLVQEHNNTTKHIHILKAIEQKNIIGICEGLVNQPRYTFLEWAVAVEFWEGAYVILKYGKPTQQELQASLEIAIRTENIPLMQDLLANNARLDTKNKPFDPRIKDVLHNNPTITNLLIDHGLTLADGVKMELSIDTIETMLNKIKPKPLVLHQALELAIREKYTHIALFLLAEKGNY